MSTEHTKAGGFKLDESGPYFSRHARGGAVASRIDSQDVVASILSVEAMGDLIKAIPLFDGLELVLFCEGLEDLEFLWPDGRLLVSVKDKYLTMDFLRQEIRSFKVQHPTFLVDQNCYFRLCALRGAESRVASFMEDVDHLKARTAMAATTEDIRSEFEHKWNIDPAFVTQFELDLRDMRKESVQATALFAHVTRRTFPVAACTDRFLSEMLNEFSNDIFAPARRQRNGVNLNQLHKQVLERIAPNEIATVQAEFQSTPFGYIRDQSRVEHLASEDAIRVRARKAAIRKWRKHTRIERSLLPRVNCLVCNHPMMGGFNGRNGFVCPDCNYLPFGTLFYACECGHPVALLAQPDLDGINLFGQAIRATRATDLKCTGCGRSVDETRLGTRIFWLAVPWPLKGSVDNMLIAMRIAMGRPKKKYTPEEARTWLLKARQNPEISRPTESGLFEQNPVSNAVFIFISLAARIALVLLVGGWALHRFL